MFNTFSVCLYGVVLGKRGVSGESSVGGWLKVAALTTSYRDSIRSRSPDHVFYFNLCRLLSVRPSVTIHSRRAPHTSYFFSGIYLQYTRHRTKPFKLPYAVAFSVICIASLGVYTRFPTPGILLTWITVGSIIVSVKAGQNALCSVFSSFPSNQDCKWGGVSIILPWVSAICGGYPLSLSRHIGKLIFGLSGAGGLVCIMAEKQVGPVEVLRKGAREDLERLQREWLKGCYEENLKRSSHSIDSEREEFEHEEFEHEELEHGELQHEELQHEELEYEELEHEELEYEEPEAGPSDLGFDPYALANVAYPESIHSRRQSIPTDLWRYDPGPILPKRYTNLSEEIIDEEGDGNYDYYAEEGYFVEPRNDLQPHNRYSDTMSMSQPDTDELNDVLDIRSLVYFPPNHPTMEDVHSATANLSDLNSHLLGRLTPSDVGTPEQTLEETSCWEDDGMDEEVVSRKKKKLRPRRVDSGSVRPPKNFVVRFEDPPTTREPLTIIVTPPTPLPNRGFF